MNCLRISPGTVRKPGAMLRKCSAHAFRSIDGGSLYCTIAVIIDSTPLLLLRGLLQRRLWLSECCAHRCEGRGYRIGAVGAGAGFVQLAVGGGLSIAAHRDRQTRQPGSDPFGRNAVHPLPFTARRAEVEINGQIARPAPQIGP